MAQTRILLTSQPVAELREKVALANRLLHHHGLTTYLGHVSARIPGTDLILIKGRPHISMDRTRAENLMVLDLDGNLIEASPQYPDIVDEWPLHTEIYKARPDVAAVVHTHQKWCSILGIAGKPVLPVHLGPGAAVAAEPWPVYEESYDIIRTVEQAKVVAHLLGKHIACHLRTHGMVFVGVSVERAVGAAVRAEHLAEMTWRAMLIGTPATIPMYFLRETFNSLFQPEEEVWRDGVERGTWRNQVWLDEHPEVARHRGVQL